jgi:lipoprotein
MKSILKLAVIALAVLVSSCGKSDDNATKTVTDGTVNIVGGKHFPKKQIFLKGSEKEETTYEVVNGKITKEIISSNSEDYVLTYVYEGNLLKKKVDEKGVIEDEYFYSNGKLIKKNNLKETFEYEYDTEGRLVKVISYIPYNPQKHITKIEYISNSIIKETESNGNVITYTVSNGNLIKSEGRKGILTYEYDNKNNWKHNDFFKTIKPDYFLNSGYSRNNMIKYSDNGNEESKSIEYNSAGYPIKIILSKSEVIQYEY